MATIVYTDSSDRERSVSLGPDQPVVSIGRASDCTIRSTRKSVSRHHVEFRYNAGTFEVVDLNSSNGTWLIENDQRFEITHERLEDQDEIWCGDFIVHFQIDDPSDGRQPDSDPAVFGEQQQFVSGPTEAADAYSSAEAQSVGQQTAGQQSDRAAESVGGSSVDRDYHGEVQELDADDFIEVDESPQFGRAEGVDTERLLEEKQSIEQLASRQAREIEQFQADLAQKSSQVAELTERLERAEADGAEAGEIQAELDQTIAELEALRGENKQLRDRFDSDAGQSENLALLESKVDRERRRADGLAEQVGSAEHARDEARDRLEEARNEAARFERKLVDKSGHVDALEQEVRSLEAKLAETAGSSDEIEDVRQKLEQARAERDKHDRLLTEYERRNADLRSELEEQRHSKDELRAAAEENEAKLAELFDTRDDLRRQLDDLDGLRAELDQTSADLDEADQLIDDLKAEVQGLKQRLQLQRRRDDAVDIGEIDRLEAELVEAAERVADLEADRQELTEQLAAANESGDDDRLAADACEAIRMHLESLERLVDAVKRTDLGALSTVDRIRLESAIRDSDPKEALREALDLLG